ncbi:glycosyltransferase family 1 protein [Micromonospora polyrhachis]|uniref:Glycosyltransferase involved in cell wall biosynthesis n=1 Tax=Micromonospora polyrhachis TaxID=1282883 RepID=A0A7W7SLA4_9ACTN|nr:glycosyltransferase involved in cell wall biosynthesis [Micromonospora polyrhachis]
MLSSVQRRSTIAAPPSPPAHPHPVRVAHVIGSLDRGGAETVSLDICRAVPATEVEQTFITLAGREGSLAGEFRATGALIQQCPLRPVSSFPVRLLRLFQSLRPDVVVSHISLASAVVLLAARIAKIPVRVARLQSAEDGRRTTPARRARRWLLRHLLRHTATDVLGVTGAALNFARPPAGDTRYRVLYNSVATARVAGWDRPTARRHWKIPEDAHVIVHIGRAAPEKNRPFLIDVHAAVRELWPDTVLLSVGPGGTDDLTSARPEIVDDPLVLLAGEAEEIASVLAAADVLLLPSRWEGLPGVILEALAAGVPVVATDLPCLRELSTQVRGITLLPLAEGPLRWADATMCQAQTSSLRRQEIRQSLRSSPFLLDHAVRQWRTLWQAGQR